MLGRKSQLTEKYKWLRRQPDPISLSRPLKTVFNKFIKKGKKARSRREVYAALTRFKQIVRNLEIQYAIVRGLRNLTIQLILMSTRKGKKIIDIPVPLRRNRANALAIQTFANAARGYHARTLWERFLGVLLGTTMFTKISSATRERTRFLRRIYEERTNIDEREK